MAVPTFPVDFVKLIEGTYLSIRHRLYFYSDDFSTISSGNTLVEWIPKCVRLCEDHRGAVSGASQLKKQLKVFLKFWSKFMRRWGVDFD
jgi:hypothetical protein